MHTLRFPALSLALAWALGQPLATLAQASPSTPPDTDHATHHTTSSAPAALPWTEAEVRRIDAVNGKVSLRHGPIVNLDMPPMTMVFQMRDASQLQGIAPGARVRFTVDQINGQYTVLQLESLQ